jgi:hypothetical protein
MARCGPGSKPSIPSRSVPYLPDATHDPKHASSNLSQRFGDTLFRGSAQLSSIFRSSHPSMPATAHACFAAIQLTLATAPHGAGAAGTSASLAAIQLTLANGQHGAERGCNVGLLRSNSSHVGHWAARSGTRLQRRPPSQQSSSRWPLGSTERAAAATSAFFAISLLPHSSASALTRSVGGSLSAEQLQHPSRYRFAVDSAPCHIHYRLWGGRAEAAEQFGGRDRVYRHTSENALRGKLLRR